MRKYQATPILYALFPVLALFYGASSLFASPLGGLTPAEQDYHDKIFDYVMDTVNPDNKQDWASYSGKGTIAVGNVFLSKSKANCREYTEDFIVQGSAGKIKGYACRRSNGDGWCRLKADQEVLSCALENKGFSIGGGGNSGGIGNGGSYNVTGPTVNGPEVSVGNISGPNVNVSVDTSGISMPKMRSGNNGGARRQNNNNNGQPDPGNNNGKGEASDTAYTVTDTLGTGAAKGTGAAIGLFRDWFR